MPLVWTLARVGEIRYTADQMAADARDVWLPVGTEIAHGAVPYLPPAVDNKPPLWVVLQALAASTEADLLVMLLVTGAAHVLLALSIRRLATPIGGARVGTLAALVYVLGLPAFGLVTIADTTVAVALLAAAIATHHARLSGILGGAAVLTSPWALLGAPAVVAYYPRSRAWVRRATTTAVAVGVVTLGGLWLAYGPDSALNAIRYSVGLGDAYWTSNQALHRRSLLYAPEQWAATMGSLARTTAIIAVPAMIGLLQCRTWRHLTPFTLAVALLAEYAAVVTLRVMAGEPVAVAARRRVGRTVAVGFLVGVVVRLLVGVGIAAFVLPGVFLAVSLLFAHAAVAVDDAGFGDAFGTAWGLAAGRRLDVLGVVSLLLALYLVPRFVAAVVPGSTGLLLGGVAIGAGNLLSSGVVGRAYVAAKRVGETEAEETDPYDAPLGADDIPEPE